jgi:hypothetical protein
MGVSESVDPAMAADASLIGFGEAGQAGGGGEVGQEISDAEFGVGCGQIEVGQPIHASEICRSLKKAALASHRGADECVRP